MIEVNKKEKESTNNLMRRFSRKVRQSGLIYDARKNMYRKRNKNKNQQKRTALRREKLRRLRRVLLKRGELNPREKMDLSKIRDSK